MPILDERGQFVSNRVSARYEQGFLSVPPQRIEYMDIAPRQIVGISAALIPFLSHDAANRALMGSNMQRQAVALADAGRLRGQHGHGAAGGLG